MGKTRKALKKMLDEKSEELHENAQCIMRLRKEEDRTDMNYYIYRGRDIDLEVSLLIELKRRAQHDKA